MSELISIPKSRRVSYNLSTENDTKAVLTRNTGGNSFLLYRIKRKQISIKPLETKTKGLNSGNKRHRPVGILIKIKWTVVLITILQTNK